MNKGLYLETQKYRCLMEHFYHQDDSFYLIMCGIEHCTTDKSYGPARRSGYHLHVVLSGEGYFESRGERTEVHAGQLFLEKPGEVTYYYPNKDNPWTYCWMTFDGCRACSYMEEAGFVDGINIRNSYVDINEFFNLTNQLLSKPDLTLSQAMQRLGLLHEYVGMAIESNLLSGNSQRITICSPDSYVDYALDYIHNNYSSIRVTDVSNYVGINRSYFSHLFKQRTGISPRDYLYRVRLRKSAQLLLSTQLPIQSVAEIVGYDNPLTFSKAFKNAYGVSPKYYRTQPEKERVVLDVPDVP